MYRQKQTTQGVISMKKLLLILALAFAVVATQVVIAQDKPAEQKVEKVEKAEKKPAKMVKKTKKPVRKAKKAAKKAEVKKAEMQEAKPEAK
jgi:Ni/Co efflux regulator RcnB